MKVTTERRNHILLITLSRPEKKNSFDPEMIRQLSLAYSLLDQDKNLRCGVLCAKGDYFTSGLDLPKIMKSFHKEILSPAIPRRGIDPWATVARPCRKPIVSAVEGRCLTLGLELLLACQINVASEKATFTQMEISRGIFPIGGGTVRWPLAVGTNNAYMHLLTADEFDANEAYRIGLLQKITPHGKALEEALLIAEKICQQAPLAVQATLESVRTSQLKGAKTALGRLRRKFFRLLLSKDVRRGVKAMKNKSTPEFEGN